MDEDLGTTRPDREGQRPHRAEPGLLKLASCLDGLQQVRLSRLVALLRQVQRRSRRSERAGLPGPHPGVEVAGQSPDPPKTKLPTCTIVAGLTVPLAITVGVTVPLSAATVT